MQMKNTYTALGKMELLDRFFGKIHRIKPSLFLMIKLISKMQLVLPMVSTSQLLLEIKQELPYILMKNVISWIPLTTWITRTL